MKSSRAHLFSARKIAVVRTDRLGDMVLTLPLCKSLKDNCSKAELHIIARRYVEPLLENCPAIDKAFFIDDYKKGINEILKKVKYDVVFFPRPRFNECWEGFKAGIPLRIGSAYRYYSILMNNRVHDHRKTAEFHEAEFNTRLAESVLGMQLKTELVKPFIDQSSVVRIENILNNNGLETDKKFIIIHPGSGGSAFTWHAENFGLLGRELEKKSDIKIIITGNEQENIICNVVQEYCKCSVNLCGKLSIKEMIALISKSNLLIANSTGIIHISAAMDVPVIGLYPNTPHLSPKRWGPYSKKSIVITPPEVDNFKERDNMNRISIDEVMKAVEKLLILN